MLAVLEFSVKFYSQPVNKGRILIQKIEYLTESTKLDIILTPYQKFVAICEIHQLFEAATIKNQHFQQFSSFLVKKKTIYEILG